MKHTHKLFKESEDSYDFLVIEDFDKDNPTYWSLGSLIELHPFIIDKSFIRTREWTLNNHPELML